jgi:hypothetical protein
MEEEVSILPYPALLLVNIFQDQDLLGLDNLRLSNLVLTIFWSAL